MTIDVLTSVTFDKLALYGYSPTEPLYGLHYLWLFTSFFRKIREVSIYFYYVIFLVYL